MFGVAKICPKWSKTTPNYWMMVERYPNLKEEVGGSILKCEYPLYLTKNLSSGHLLSGALAMACRLVYMFDKVFTSFSL